MTQRPIDAPLSAQRYETPLGAPHSRNSVLVGLAAQGRRVLEFGCANGFISRHLAERGCKVTGLDIDPEAVAQAKEWCEQALVVDLERTDWATQLTGKFDTILFGDVLEHLSHPDRTLRATLPLLAPGGRIIVSLPNIAHWSIRASLLRGKFEYQSTGILDITHLRFFTPQTARRFLEDNGFKVISAHFFVGGGSIGRRIRMLSPGLFATQMMFVIQPCGG